jgi:hypothetical protein
MNLIASAFELHNLFRECACVLGGGSDNNTKRTVEVRRQLKPKSNTISPSRLDFDRLQTQKTRILKLITTDTNN